MLKVGITGGIGAGKTTVCRRFEALGIPVYYADTAAKRLMYRDPILKAAIKRLLGDNAYHRNGRPDRSYIASKVFKDADLLEALNQLVHPAVGRDASAWFDDQAQHAPYGLYEAALLVENRSYKDFDYLISVSAPEEVRINRVMARDGITREQVAARLKHQLPQAQKDDVADYVITNVDLAGLQAQVDEVHRALIGKGKARG
jgi:dephospho-CoA kinase